MKCGAAAMGVGLRPAGPLSPGGANRLFRFNYL
jgi:hypothetical protein